MFQQRDIEAERKNPGSQIRLAQRKCSTGLGPESCGGWPRCSRMDFWIAVIWIPWDAIAGG